MAIQYKVIEPDCGIRVTKVNMYAVSNKLYTKAIVSVELNGAILIRDMCVMEGQYGLFVAYPLDKNSMCEEGRFIVELLDDTVRTYIEAVVLNKYNEVIEAANQSVGVKEWRA